MVFRVEDNFNVNFQLAPFEEGIFYYKTAHIRYSKLLPVLPEYKDSFILLDRKGDIYTFNTPYVFNNAETIIVEGFEYYPKIFLLNEDEELYYCILIVV